MTGTPGTVEVRIDDLAFTDADALARPVTATLQATTPLLRRVELAGGASLLAQLRTAEPLAVGSAIVTGAGDLGVELMVHAVVSSVDEPVTRGSVRRALASALQRAGDWGVRHLALPPFGLGAGNLAIEDSAEVMMDVIGRHMRAQRAPLRVTVVVESDGEAEAFLARVGVACE
jgi:O-acetyl-ADP-ribose deacetylase (regulator of RNase III)